MISVATPEQWMDRLEDSRLTKLERITKARNLLRKLYLFTDNEYLLFLDSDIIVGARTKRILLNTLRTHNVDILYNSYLVHNGNVCTSGLGCTLIKREVLEKIKFRCGIDGEKKYAFVDECLYFQLDALKAGFRVKEGVFIETNHAGRILKPRERTRKEKISYAIRWCMHPFVDIYPIMLLWGTLTNFVYTHTPNQVHRN
jgi:hypothetical protein